MEDANTAPILSTRPAGTQISVPCSPPHKSMARWKQRDFDGGRAEAGRSRSRSRGREGDASAVGTAVACGFPVASQVPHDGGPSCGAVPLRQLLGCRRRYRSGGGPSRVGSPSRGVVPMAVNLPAARFPYSGGGSSFVCGGGVRLRAPTRSRQPGHGRLQLTAGGERMRAAGGETTCAVGLRFDAGPSSFALWLLEMGGFGSVTHSCL